MTQPHKFQLGAKLKDKVTLIEGIAVARVEYLTGCTQYGLQRQKKDGDVNTIYLDETRLTVTGKGVTLEIAKADAGGPSDHAPRGNQGPR